jgi:TRAP-type C4-dicarboxylate transport system permease small subunit
MKPSQFSARRGKMGGFVNVYLKLMDFLDGLVQKLCVFIAGLMTIAVGLQVLSRYILKYPLVWTEELARYLMVWMVFIGASTIIKKWNNIYVDFFISKLTKKNRIIAILIEKCVIVVLLVYFSYLCFMVFSKVGGFQTSPAMGISMLWPQSGMIAGFFLMALQGVGVILDDIFNKNILKFNKEISNNGGIR